MTTLALATAAHPNAHPNDIETANPCAPCSKTIRPSLNTSLKLAGTGLAFLGAAACLAVDLANDAGHATTHHSNRSLLQNYEGCKEGEARYNMSAETETRYKWAFVGQASAVGVGLLAFPFIRILPDNNCTFALLAPPLFGGCLATTGLLVTGIFYGLGKANDGRCISTHQTGRS